MGCPQLTPCPPVCFHLPLHFLKYPAGTASSERTMHFSGKEAGSKATGHQRSPAPVALESRLPVLLLRGLQQGEKDAVPSVLRHTPPPHTHTSWPVCVPRCPLLSMRDRAYKLGALGTQAAFPGRCGGGGGSFAVIGSAQVFLSLPCHC